MSIRNTCVVGAIMMNDNNALLLQHRTDDHTWCIPGGGVEIGETVEEAVKREVFEETGLRIREMELFKIYSGESQYHQYPDGNEYYFVNIVFKVKKYDGILESDGVETKELKYFMPHNLPKNIAKTNIPIFEHLTNAL